MNPYTLPRHDCAHFTISLAFAVIVMFGTISLQAVDNAEANILLAEPVHGSFTTARPIMAHGRVDIEGLSDVVLTVNGEVVTPAADGSFTHPVTLDAARIFNPVLVELTAAGNTIARRQPVVIVGSSISATALAPESLAVRLTDRGLNQLEMLISRFVVLDVAGLLPSGPVFSDEVCEKIPPFGPDVCADVTVTIDDDPAPRLGAVEVGLDAQPDRVALALALRDLFVRANVEADAGPFSVSCSIDIRADAMQVNGAIRLEPGAADPATIDVMQDGAMGIQFVNFGDAIRCNGPRPLRGVIEALAKALVGDIRDLVQEGLSDFLNKIDAAGNTPLANLLENVLGTLALEDVINASIADTGLQVQVPFARISEDSSGVTFVVDTSVEALPNASCTPSQDNPALAAVYDVPQPLPVLGVSTPGGLPFDAGGVVSATALNQALRGATACGLLQAEFTEIDIDGNTTPITAGLLGGFLPAFDQLDPTQPIRVVLSPTLAPVVSSVPGPAGASVDLRVAAYVIDMFFAGETSPIMQLALDLRAGLDLQLDPATGAVQPRIGEIADWSATLIINPLGVDPARIDFFIEQLLPEIDGLNDDLEPLMIPSVEGLDFALVEVSRIDAACGAFLDIIVQP